MIRKSEDLPRLLFCFGILRDERVLKILWKNQGSPDQFIIMNWPRDFFSGREESIITMETKLGKNFFMGVILSCYIFLGCSLAIAEEEAYTLDEIVVTATKTTKVIQDVPASISVVTAKEIEAKNVNSVTEALQMKAGVFMDQAAQGGLMIRGFDSTDILVLIDGQPVNSGYNNGMNWELVPVENIERIEFLRGAASSLYGGRAVGAVINIITKDNKKPVSLDATVSYGSNNTWKKSVKIDTMINNKISLGAGYENRSSDGYRGYYRSLSGRTASSADYEAVLPKLSNGYYVVGGRGEKDWENESYSFNVKYIFDESRSIKYTFMSSENIYSYNNPFSFVYDGDGNQVFSGTVMTQDGTRVSLSPSRFLGYEGKRETDLHTLNFNDNKNKIVFNLGLTDTKRDGYSSPSSPTDVNWTGAGTDSFYPSKTYNMDLQKEWDNIGKHTIVSGLNAKQESFDQKRSHLDNWKDHDSVNSDYGLYEKHGGKARNLAFFIQDEYKFSDPFIMYLGVRYDHYKKYDGYSRYINEDGSLERSLDHGEGSYSELSPKIAFEYEAGTNSNYYASYGHSFNPPPLYQIYRDGGGDMGDVIANPQLDPEVSDTYEIGMKKKLFSKTDIGIALYTVKTDDKIIYTTHYTPGTTTAEYKRYENHGTEKRHGIELEFKYRFTDAFETHLNYAWQKGRIILDEVTDTNLTNSTTDNYDIPEHLLNAGISYKKDRWNILLDSQYVSERQSPDSETGEYGSEDAFFIVNMALNFKIIKNTSLQVNINNLFDDEFYSNEATSGRTYTAGIRYSF